MISVSVEHSAGSGCNVCKWSALSELDNELFLQNEEDVELGRNFFPVIFLTELP